MAKQVVVIGGGIMGLCTAYYLHKEGHQVTVVDRSGMDGGASYVNAGYLTPSHIIPLAAPGMMAKGIKWMLNSSSPFYLKPRLDTDFLRWAWQFHRSSTPSAVARAIPIIAEINVHSKALYEELLSGGDLGTFQLVREGLLMLYKSEAAGKAERAVMHQVQDQGLEARELSAEQLQELQPGLRPDLAGAIHYQCDAHTTPNEVMPLLQAYLKRNGVALLPHTEVTGFTRRDDRITTVKTADSVLEADEVVLAAGAWSPLLMRALGLRLSLQAGKGYRIDIPGATPVRIPAILMESKVAITPMKGFTRLAGTMELSGINHQIRENRVRAIARATADYYTDFPVPETAMETARCGLRPVSPDGLPYIGRTRQWKNLTLATGHAMMGWSLGPITGKLISEVISDRPPTMDLAAFDPDRRF